MWLVLSLLVFIFPSAVDSWCAPNTYGDWHSWSSCSASCGGGTRSRYKEQCVLSTKKWDTGSCNTICYNRGTYSNGRCRCQGWRYGQCCENCNYGYQIQHCLPSSVVCGGHPDNVKCTHCIDPYYSGGYGGGCILCPGIDNCESRHCTSRTNTICLHCIEDNSYFKRTQTDTRCERLCAWNNHYCWPGSCSSDNLAKNCQCVHGFTRVSNGSETSCQLSSTKTPTLEKCETSIWGKNGEMKQTVSSTLTRECNNMGDMYGNFLPYELTFDVAADYIITIPATLTKPYYISEYKFGITDCTVNVTLRSVTGSESVISIYAIHEDDGTGTNALSTFYNKTTLSIGSQVHTIQDGEWLCIHYEAKAGGYLKSFDFRNSTRMPSSPVPYRKTVTQKELCYRFDNSPPEHCSKFKSCNLEPLQILNRITRSSVVSVLFNGWSDPIPNSGNKDQASGIESYEIIVHNVDPSSGSVKVISTATPVFLRKVDANTTSMMMNLSSDSSRLYAISLAIKDVADNVQYARRFLLIDNSSFIETDKTKSFYVKSASKKTNSTWQINHNDICITWKDYFFNREYPLNSVLNPIEPGPLGMYTEQYDQFDKPLPLTGTDNLYGITRFFFSWQRNNGNVSNEIIVPQLKNQQYCRQFNVQDGESYTLNIRAVDIVNNSLAENRTVHIDRSVPFINNMCLTKDNVKQLFVHDQADLSKMELYFESFDPNSGINTVEWAFGTSDAGKELVTGHTVPRRIKTNCSVNETKCYCPTVGECEIYAYKIDLKSLVHINKEIGQHNRNYYFTVKVTNNALLTNTEHLDILVDDSPTSALVDFEETTTARQRTTSWTFPTTTMSIDSTTPSTNTTAMTFLTNTTMSIGEQLSSAVTINCNEFGWDVRVDMGIIRTLYPSVVASDIYLGDNRCTGILKNNVLTFQQELRQCLTSEIVRDGALVYSNELLYAQHDPNHPFLISKYPWTVPIECDIIRNETSQGHVHHLGHSVITAPTVVSQNHYPVNISFYQDPNFVHIMNGNPIQVKVGSKIYVKIFTKSPDWTVKMKVSSCYTKPSPSSPDSTKYYIIKNGCEVDSNTHYLTQSYHETKFVFQDFEYNTNHEGIYLFCETTYCKSTDSSSTCRQACITVVKRSMKPQDDFL